MGLFHAIEKSKVRCICTCNELNAAYAADGYARIKGIGALATTYVVGELSAINGVAGSFAERVPVVQITGCPATKHYKLGTLLHHTLGNYLIPLQMYEKITIASTLLDDAFKAPSEIDRVLRECVYHKLPVYIALPTDISMAPCAKPSQKLQIHKRPVSDPKMLNDLIQKTTQMLERAKKPIILVDGGIIRFNMQKVVQAFIESSGIPFASRMLGKSAIEEHHPLFIGLYQGDRSREYVQKRVEGADCILALGTMLTDFNTGGFTANLDEEKTIWVNIEQTRIRYSIYNQINFVEFLEHLKSRLKPRNPAEMEIKNAVDGCPHRATLHYAPEKGKKLTLTRFFDRASHILNEHAIMMVETGSALFAGAEVLQPKGCQFMSQTFFGSIGYTVGATLGASIAAPQKRVITFVGDGSFQVTAPDLSTMIRYHLHPIIFLINNDGYLVERVIFDGPFNDLQPWNIIAAPFCFWRRLGMQGRNRGRIRKSARGSKQTSKRSRPHRNCAR